MSEYNLNADVFNIGIHDAEPGDIVHVSGGLIGSTLYIPKSVVGTTDKHITLDFQDVEVSASLAGGSAFALSGSGQSAYIDMVGKVTLCGGSNNFYCGRSDVDMTGLEHWWKGESAGDAGKHIGSMEKAYPLPWQVERVHYGLIDVTGKTLKQVFDNTGGWCCSIDHLRVHDVECTDVVMGKNLCLGMHIRFLEVRNCKCSESVLILGGACLNSSGMQAECANAVVERMLLVNVDAKRGIALASALNCTVVRAVAENCRFSLGAVVAAEGVLVPGTHDVTVNTKQGPSEGCTVNGFPWVPSESPWPDFPPVPVEEPPAPPVVVPLTREEVQVMIEKRVAASQKTTDLAFEEMASWIETKSFLGHTHKPLVGQIDFTIGPAVEPTPANVAELKAENARLRMRLGAASADKAWLTETDRVNAEQAALAAKGSE